MIPDTSTRPIETIGRKDEYSTLLEKSPEVRIEQDSLGELPIPKDAYWGIHTARALVNFPITKRSISVYPEFVVALAQIKQAAARSNKKLGLLTEFQADAIDAACQEIIEGKLHKEFKTGVITGGAGTSQNMTANEVITNRALELMGYEKGDYVRLSPNDHTNKGQSTNDVYPTAVKLSLASTFQRLLKEHRLLVSSLHRKGKENEAVLKMGRTQLQDAVPMTVGQEFHAWGNGLFEDQALIQAVIEGLKETNLGGTAIGTGIAADRGFRKLVNEELSLILGYDLRSAYDLIGATNDTGIFMSASGALKRAAAKLSKMSNDLRLLSSGPQTGFRELNLPARQAGSSIMAGKVNPVIPEVMNQVYMTIVGTDATVTAASEAGQLQLNAFEPVIAHSLLQSSIWLTNAIYTLRVNCIEGIEVNEAFVNENVENSAGLITALLTRIGYKNATLVQHEAVESKKSIRQVILERGLIPEDELNELLSIENLVGLG